MRKLLLYLIALLLLAGAVLIVIRGIALGSIAIYSFLEISAENTALEKLIYTAVKTKDVKYSDALNQQKQAYDTLINEKASYQQLLELGVDENGIPLSKIQEYEIEKIWITLGNYADKQGVDLRMDITVNNSVAKTYDLNFTVVGEYIQIADFLYDIQRDNTLVFNIENFKLVLSEQVTETITDGEETNSEDTAEESENTTNEETETTEVTSYKLAATFVCKDIRLNIVAPVPEDTTDGENAEETEESGTEETNEEDEENSTEEDDA